MTDKGELVAGGDGEYVWSVEHITALQQIRMANNTQLICDFRITTTSRNTHHHFLQSGRQCHPTAQCMTKKTSTQPLVFITTNNLVAYHKLP